MIFQDLMMNKNIPSKFTFHLYRLIYVYIKNLTLTEQFKTWLTINKTPEPQTPLLNSVFLFLIQKGNRASFYIFFHSLFSEGLDKNLCPKVKQTNCEFMSG